jgi:hypothetical protein
MLKRFSSLILALVIGSSVLVGTARPQDEHVCQMAGMEMMPEHGNDAAGMEMMPGMEAMPGMEMMPAQGDGAGAMEAMPGHGEDAGGMEMPCCKKHKTQSVVSECCINIPQETGSSAATFNVRMPSSSLAVIHPAVVQSLLAAPKPRRSYSTEVFLPNLQACYIRNLSLLI